jgi:hypothetical protein
MLSLPLPLFAFKPFRCASERLAELAVVGYSVKLLRDAIDTLMSSGGANAFAEKSPLQRM